MFCHKIPTKGEGVVRSKGCINDNRWAWHLRKSNMLQLTRFFNLISEIFEKWRLLAIAMFSCFRIESEILSFQFNLQVSVDRSSFSMCFKFRAKLKLDLPRQTEHLRSICVKLCHTHTGYIGATRSHVEQKWRWILPLCKKYVQLTEFMTGEYRQSFSASCSVSAEGGRRMTPTFCNSALKG